MPEENVLEESVLSDVREEKEDQPEEKSDLDVAREKGNLATGIDEVLVRVTLLHIADVAIPCIGRCRIFASGVGFGSFLGGGQCAVSVGRQVAVISS